MKHLSLAILFSVFALLTAQPAAAGDLQPPCFPTQWYAQQALQDLRAAEHIALLSSSGAISNSDRAFLNLEFQALLAHINTIASQTSSCLSPQELAHIQSVLNQNALGLLGIDVTTADNAWNDALPSVRQAVRTVRSAFGGSLISSTSATVGR